MKNDDENVIRISVRLNVKIPQHAKINAVLLRLDRSIYKSRGQFLLDAVEYYIDHFGEARFTTHEEDGEFQFATVKQLEELKSDLMMSAQSIAKDEVIKQFGSILKEMASSVTVSIDDVKSVANVGITKEDIVNQEDDEVMSELVSSWM